MASLKAEEWLGMLTAWQIVRSNGWPGLCPTMNARSAEWPSMSAAQLEYEVQGFLREMNAPSCQARVFWKSTPRYAYVGVSDNFARDDGFANAAEIVGRDDFDPRFVWSQQAAKYRADDERVVTSNKPLLGILERQTRSDAVVYVQTNKAPLWTGGKGLSFGVLGMYETLDEATARRLFHAKMRETGF